MFQRALVTSNYIFFCDFKECDDNGNTRMYRKNNALVSDNYFASVGLIEELELIHNGEIIPEYIHPDLENYIEEIVIG